MKGTRKVVGLRTITTGPGREELLDGEGWAP
jgi:hypothetical protein